MQEMQAGSLGQEGPLEEAMATPSSILAWRIPWTQEPEGYSPWGCQSWTQLTNMHFKCFYNLRLDNTTNSSPV